MPLIIFVALVMIIAIYATSGFIAFLFTVLIAAVATYVLFLWLKWLIVEKKRENRLKNLLLEREAQQLEEQRAKEESDRQQSFREWQELYHLSVDYCNRYNFEFVGLNDDEILTIRDFSTMQQITAKVKIGRNGELLWEKCLKAENITF